MLCYLCLLSILMQGLNLLFFVEQAQIWNIKLILKKLICSISLNTTPVLQFKHCLYVTLVLISLQNGIWSLASWGIVLREEGCSGLKGVLWILPDVCRGLNWSAVWAGSWCAVTAHHAGSRFLPLVWNDVSPVVFMSPTNLLLHVVLSVFLCCYDEDLSNSGSQVSWPWNAINSTV